jgi:hypothetical protein
MATKMPTFLTLVRELFGTSRPVATSYALRVQLRIENPSNQFPLEKLDVRFLRPI